MSVRMVRCAARVAVVALVATVLVFARRDFVVASETVIPTRAEEVAGRVEREAVFRLPFAAKHVALHWAGHHEAQVSVALSGDGQTFDAPEPVLFDDVGEGHPNGETYGSIMAAAGATHVRVVSDRPIGRVSVLALVDGEPQTVTRRLAADEAGAAGIAPPGIVSRQGWKADESLRFRGPREIWPRVHERVQKLIVHHTATSNEYADADAAMAEIRAVYYYHAVTQGWGDIGYNFIVDRFGTLYKGRHSGNTADVDTANGEDGQGRVVTAGHTYQHNVGTVGVAVLGTFTADAPPEAAKNTIVDFLAWESDSHQLDPDRTSTYRNVVNDLTRDTINVAAHRDYNVDTACPGQGFYDLLNQGGLRSSVVAALKAAHGGTWTGDVTEPPAPTELTATGGRRKITLSWKPSSEAWPAQSGVAYYEIQRSTATSESFAVIDHASDKTLTFTDSGLRSDYSYRIVAVDGAGNRGPASTVVTGRAT